MKYLYSENIRLALQNTETKHIFSEVVSHITRCSTLRSDTQAGVCISHFSYHQISQDPFPISHCSVNGFSFR